MIKLSAFSDEADNKSLGQVEALNRHQIPYMEIRNIDGKNIMDLTNEEVISYKKLFDENHVKVWSLGSPLGKVDIHGDMDLYYANVRRLCEIAKMFDCDKIRSFSFYKAYDCKEQVMDALKKTVEIAKEYDIKICHENEKEIYGDVLSRVEEILDSVPGIYSVYDPANYLQCGVDPRESLKSLVKRTEYFHIKDVITETGELVPAGQGDGRIEELLQMLDPNRDYVLTIEPHLAIFAGYNQIDNTEMKNKYHFSSNGEAFDAAVNSLKKLLEKVGYHEENGAFRKD